jgi:hypothetical protein
MWPRSTFDMLQSRLRRRWCQWRLAVSLLILSAAGVLLVGWPARVWAADPNDFTVWSDPTLPGHTAQMNSNIDPLLEEAKRRGAFLYAPQSAGGVWGSTPVTPTADVQKAVSMMRAAQASYPGINDDRLYLTGLSYGGGGAWDALASYPKTFAAGAPICGSLGSSVYRESLEDEKIWTFHARDDSVVSVSNTRNMVNAIFTGDGFAAATFPPLGSAGDAYYAHGQLQYSEPAVGGHGIWEVAYRQPELYDWMFAQSVPEPAGAAALLLLLGGAARYGRRRNAQPIVSKQRHVTSSPPAKDGT